MSLNVFRRSLLDGNLLAWHHLVMSVKNIELSDTRDTFKWSFGQQGLFSVPTDLGAGEHGLAAEGPHAWQSVTGITKSGSATQARRSAPPHPVPSRQQQ